MYKKFPTIDEETLAKYPFIKHYAQLIEESLLGEWEENIATVDELNKYFLYEYCYGEHDLESIINSKDGCWEWESKRYKKMKKAIEDGYSIINKSVDYHEEVLNSLIKNLHDGENIIVDCTEG